MKMVPMQTNMETKEKIALAKRYEPTGEEKTAMEATRARRVKAPRIKAKHMETGAVGFRSIIPIGPTVALCL